MKKVSLLFLLLSVIVCQKAMADVDVFVHIPVETTGDLAGNPNPANAPYLYDQKGSLGAYPGSQMTNLCKVNDVMYFYATITGVTYADIVISNGNSVQEGNSVTEHIAASNGSTNAIAYFFWDIKNPTTLVDYYPVKVYIGEPFDNGNDPNAGSSVKVWFKDNADPNKPESMCGTDSYPAWPGISIADLPTEEIFGKIRHFYTYKHHTDEGPVIVFNDGNDVKDAAIKTDEIPALDGYVYTFSFDGSAFTAASEEVQLHIDETTFPNATFRKYIDDNYDVTNNDKLTSREVNAIRNISLPSKDINDFTGLQYFTELRYLDVSGNPIAADGLSMITELPFLMSLKAKNCSNLASLPLNNVPNLQIINIDQTAITSLDFSKCPNLNYFSAYSCKQLESLNFEGVTNLEYVNLQSSNNSTLAALFNDPTTSPLSGQSTIKDLNISDCGIENSFDFTPFTKLERLSAFNNSFISPELSCQSTLKYIYMKECGITSFPFSDFPELREIKFYNNGLTTIDLSKCTKLENLEVHGNKLNMEIIDFTPQKDTIKIIHCENNANLRALNVTDCSALEELYCHANHIAELDVTTCPNLKILNCSRQTRDGIKCMDELDITHNPILKTLDCSFNNIGALDLTHCAATIQEVTANDNVLTHDTFVYTGCNDIRKLYVGNNPLLGYVNIKGMTYLKEYGCNNTGISTLDVSSSENLQLLYCYDNTSLNELILRKDGLITKLNCANCILETLDLKNNPLNGEFRINDNRFTDFDLTNYDINRHEKWYYNNLGPQYPVLPAVVVVENDENEDDILFYYTIELPESFDHSKAVLDPAFEKNVKLIHDDATGRDYFKIPREHLSLIGSDPHKYHFMYTYTIPLNVKTPTYEDRHIVKEYVTIVYPRPKFDFEGVHHSSFNPETGCNDYSNTITIKTADLLETDLNVVYKLKRFKMSSNPDGKMKPSFEKSVLSMVYEKVKIGPEGDDSDENFHYQWKVMVGDADKAENTKWTVLEMDEAYTLTDSHSYKIAESYNWYAFCYNVVRDINGPLFYEPMYTAYTTAVYPKHTIDDILADTDHSLALPKAADVALNDVKILGLEGESDVTDIIPVYLVNGTETALDEETGLLPTDIDLQHNTIHGLIGINIGTEDEPVINTYGTFPVDLQTYRVTATAKNLYKKNKKFGDNDNAGRYFWYDLDLRLGDKDETVNAECVGFRVWHTLPAEHRVEEYSGFANRFNNFCFFDNVDAEGEMHLFSLTDVGSDNIVFEDNNGIKHTFRRSIFASNHDEPELDVIVRAYYKVTPAEAPAAVKARANAEEDGENPDAENPDDENPVADDNAHYIVAEHTPTIQFSAAQTNETTGVEDIIVDTLPGVRYIDLNGRISNTPFPGAVLKLTPNPDGTLTKSLLK